MLTISKGSGSFGKDKSQNDLFLIQKIKFKGMQEALNLPIVSNIENNKNYNIM
jgi:hypothetical protein